MFGVGDDDQVIYGHAGADPAFLIDFEQLFPGAASHPLEVNYRCPVAVVDAAKTLLGVQRLPGAEGDPARARTPTRTPARSSSTGIRPKPARASWSRSCRAGSPTGCRRREIAVLTRVNSLLLAPHVALVEAGRAGELERAASTCSSAPACAPRSRTCGSASMPEQLRPDDLQEVQRRPSRGLPAVDLEVADPADVDRRAARRSRTGSTT